MRLRGFCRARLQSAWAPFCCFPLLFSFLVPIPCFGAGDVAENPSPGSRRGLVAFRLLAVAFGTPRCVLWGSFWCPLCLVSGGSTHVLLMAVQIPGILGAPGSASLSGLGPRPVRQAGVRCPAWLGWICARGGVCVLWGAGLFLWHWGCGRCPEGMGGSGVSSTPSLGRDGGCGTGLGCYSLCFGERRFLLELSLPAPPVGI